MPRLTSKSFQTQGGDSEMDKISHEWKDGRIRLLEGRLNRERTNIRLARDMNKDLEAKVAAHTETITRLQTELRSTQEELAEQKYCTAEKDSQLETFRILVEQQERDCLDLKHRYNLQLDSITKTLHENQQRVISELEEQVKSQKEEVNAKDNTITMLKFANADLETENTLVSNSLNQLKSSLGISNKKAQPKLKNIYHKKQNFKQKSMDVMLSRQSVVNLESVTSESFVRVNNNMENERSQQTVQQKPLTRNDENTVAQSNTKDGTRKHQVDDKNILQAIIPKKRPLHAISTNQATSTNRYLILPKRATWFKEESIQPSHANIDETSLLQTQLDKKNDSVVAIKIEDTDDQTIHLDLPSEQASSSRTIKSVDNKVENSTPNAPSDLTVKNKAIKDQSMQKKSTINLSKKRNDSKAINETTATSSHDQRPITPSSFASSSSSSTTTITNQQQSSNQRRSDLPAPISRLPVSAGHQHHRAHMTGETCIACANFYGNEPILANVNGEQVQVTSNDRIQAHSRHRHTKRATTPPGFWEMDFASPPENDRSRRRF